MMNHYEKPFLTILIIALAGCFIQARGQKYEMIAYQTDDTITADTAAEKGSENRGAAAVLTPEERPEILIVGGGASHNFERWFNLEDSKILTEAGANVRYTNQVEYIREMLPELDILYLSNNQPLPDPGLRKAIFEFVESGKDLLLVHAATWHNWDDWPEYNRDLVGGGSRGHDEFGEFEVNVVKADHPIMEDVPASFKITDELYYFQESGEGSEIEVLAKGIEPGTGDEFPVVWTVHYGKGQIACISLGHDDKAHHHSAYRKILQNAFSWFQED